MYPVRIMRVCIVAPVLCRTAGTSVALPCDICSSDDRPSRTPTCVLCLHTVCVYVLDEVIRPSIQVVLR